MKGLFSMIAFFTRLPVPPFSLAEEDFKRGTKLMPLVGFVTGGILFGVSFLDRIFTPSIVAFVLLAAYVVITGGLHLDGLSDSCDALFSGKDKDRMLDIMKDSRSGTFGNLSVVLACIAYFSIFPAVPREALFMFPIVGKVSAVFACRIYPYIRAEGIAKVFSENCNNTALAFAVGAIFLPCTVIYMFISPQETVSIAVSAAVALALSGMAAFSVNKTLGGITGDVLGMLCEFSQISFLFTLSAIRSFPPYAFG